MGWIIVGILAAIYLAVRFFQMGRFIIVRFFFNPAIPLPVKVVVIALLAVAVWAIRKWWRWYFRKSDAPKPQASNTSSDASNGKAPRK